MMKKRWSAAEKFQIALEAIKEDRTISDICKEHSVAPSQVHAWKKQMLEGGAQLFGKPTVAQKAQVAHERKERYLYQKIGKLSVERDYLKKAWRKLHGISDEE
jgi:transposase